MMIYYDDDYYYDLGDLCGENRKEYKILIGKPEGSRLFRRQKHAWEDNI
jgi:hypothetical protein